MRTNPLAHRQRLYDLHGPRIPNIALACCFITKENSIFNKFMHNTRYSMVVRFIYIVKKIGREPELPIQPMF